MQSDGKLKLRETLFVTAPRHSLRTNFTAVQDLPMTTKYSGNASARLVGDTETRNGGSHILTDGTLQIYGDAPLLYEIDSPILVQNISRLNFSLNVIQAS